jgi:hypothetical protein
VPDRPKPKLRSNKSASPKPSSPKKKSATLRVAKTDNEDKLDQDEVDLWLSLFGSEED